ncbi:MAG: TonB-dependent receptor plug domain-containing protein [Pseudomonadota bacterium]
MQSTTNLVYQFKKRALAASIASSLIVGPHVLAQQPAEIEEIAITGSRIRQTNGMATPVPVTSITTTELAMFNPGSSTVEQVGSLPQFFGTQSSQRNPGGINTTSGGSYLNMRGLGAQRTLILFDGSRVVPADKRGSVNVDTLPTALMRSVDVVTGGASAAYGADALGGVVNFVLDREFEGLKVEAGTGITEIGDGFRWNLSAAGGKQIGDRLHVIGSLQALEIEQIFRDPTKTDWYQGWGHVNNPAWLADRNARPIRITAPNVASTEHSPFGMMWARGGANPNASTAPLIPFSLNGYVFMPDGSDVRPFIRGDYYSAPNIAGSTKSMSGGPEGDIRMRAFNDAGAGANVVGRSGFTAIQYDINDSMSAFAQVLVGRSESRDKVTRSGFEIADGHQHTIYRENAFLPQSVRVAMDAANNGAGIPSFQLWRNGGFIENVDTAARRHTENFGVHNTYSWSVGVDAVLPNDWDLRVSWQEGEAHKQTGTSGLYRWDRVTLATDAVRDPATGAIVCNVKLYNPTIQQLAASVANRLASPGGTPGGTGSALTTRPLASPVGLDTTIRDCVPYNPFNTLSTPQEVIDYLGSDLAGDSLVTQDFAEILVSGELFEGWNGPISFAAGLTYRDQSIKDGVVNKEIDDLGPVVMVPALGIRGAGPTATGGSANFHAFSTLPVVTGQYDVWEYFGEVNVPIWESDSGAQNVGGSVAYRSSQYSSLDDDVESWKLGLDVQVYDDLRLRATKSRDVREATFAERFDAQSGNANVFDPAFNNSSFSITQTAGGNADLVPESADTVVAGFVFQPSFLAGLSLSADWYELDISDSISTLGAQRIIDDCYSGAAPQLCAQVQRVADGTLGRVFNVWLNVATYKLSGVDYEMSYRTETNFFDNQSESLSIRALAGYQRENMDVPYGATTGINLAGSLATPDLTGVLTLTYDLGPYSAQLQQRYTAGVIINPAWTEGNEVDINTAESSQLTNLRLGYSGEISSGGVWTVALNVTNLLDEAPPKIAGFTVRGGSQVVSPNYDVFGRRYQLSLNMNF